MSSEPAFRFDNSFIREMEGFFVRVPSDPSPDPKLLAFNNGLAQELGLNASGDALLDVFAGNRVPLGADPVAQVYAGHQFGGFSPQLGDGRALLLGEVIDQSGQRRDIQLKGSGPTPFSRGGDGKAVIGPVLREYLMGEAMHALGIPTTRALAAVTTGEHVMRNGPEAGAILTRVAASHLRVGTFQFFAARGEFAQVRQLADYAIVRHYPEIDAAHGTGQGRYLALLEVVIRAQMTLVAKWVSVGFVHGVMNTDNMTISGETIDYGPCAFIDAYDPNTVFSSIDHGGRYAYGRQPVVAQWNLARFAETLLPLIDADEDRAVELATEALGQAGAIYTDEWLSLMRKKIGLTSVEEGDAALINAMFALMKEAPADYTQFFRALGDAALGSDHGLYALFEDRAVTAEWLADWRARCDREEASADARASQMNGVNPIYVPRNHLVEAALQAAAAGDMAPFEMLLDVLSAPFQRRERLDAYEHGAPADASNYQTFCGT